MKVIVFSANTSWYLYNFRQSSIKAFIDKGHTVYCISPLDNYSEKLMSEFGCHWYNVDMDNKGYNVYKDIITVSQLLRLYHKIRPDYVFNYTLKNNVYGTWAAKIYGAVVINNVCGLGTAFINNNLISKIVRVLYKLSQPYADKVFCQNPDDFSMLSSNKLVNKFKLELLPGSGVNTEKFHPIFCKSYQSVFTFLFVGRILSDKGLNELIEAANLLYQQNFEFKLQICGFIDNKNKSSISIDVVNQWIKYPFIEWLGSSDDIVSVYAKADCVVLPSYREGMPKTLIEAGAMGLPSVATDVPGCKHIIKDGYNGFLCEPRNSKSLADAMKKILTLPVDDYKIICINARLKVEKEFDESIVIDKTISVLA